VVSVSFLSEQTVHSCEQLVLRDTKWFFMAWLEELICPVVRNGLLVAYVFLALCLTFGKSLVELTDQRQLRGIT